MAAKPVCLVCEVEMERGFMTDLGSHSMISLPRWCPGEPTSSFWSGEVKRSERDNGLKVIAFRCPECEALRLYAPAEASPAD